MDYDKTAIAGSYDAARGYPAAVMQSWLERCARHTGPGRVETILDLGCGTGRFSADLARHFDAKVIGVDPSTKMLAEARQKAKADGPPLDFRHGNGEALPVADSEVDLVFLSMVFHHLADPPAMARECRRTLRPGGVVLLRNGTVDQRLSYPHQPFFAEFDSVIDSQLVTCAQIDAAFSAAGFTQSHHEVVPHAMAASWQEFADKVALRADSLVARLSDADFAAGMGALRRHAETADPSAEVTVNVDFFAFVAPPASTATQRL